LNLRAIGFLRFGCCVGLLALPLAAAPKGGRISGVVVDPGGTPQMGATVLVSSEQLLSPSAIQLLTNDRGHFSTAGLPAGPYSVKVTLAGFLPAMEQHVEVNDQRITLLEIVLGSVFSSLERLRRQPDQRVASDDWTWVLRTSTSTRSVLQWQDSQLDLAERSKAEAAQSEANHGRLVLSSGQDHPGSIGNSADLPATAFVYDMGIGPQAQLLMAGQFSYGGVASSSALAGEWLPSGKPGIGPVTTLVVRESRMGPNDHIFRGLRISHDDQLALSDRVSVRYGGEYVLAEFARTTAALRPRGELSVQLGRNWRASAAVATHAWEDDTGSSGALESTLNALDRFPTLMLRNGRPVLENDRHEEISLAHAWNESASLGAALFHDGSTHTAVIGRGASSAPDFLQDYFSQAFAYDGGRLSSTGTRAVYKQKFGANIDTTVVYAYAGALAPNRRADGAPLREELSTQYRHSLAARISAKVPRVGTKFSAGYKWLSGPTVSSQDAYGESMYHIDPYLSMQICQPLPSVFPGHMEVHADTANLLAQGYVPLSTPHGGMLLVPSYRFLRGGLSFQF
jgi:hypothetical protein